MRTKITMALGSVVMVALASMASGSPQDKPLPPTHPAVEAPDVEPVERAAANMDDVASPGAVVQAYYDSISGPKGQARDWGRFLSLFADDARFTTVRKVDGKVIPITMTPREYVAANRRYFERGGYFETEINDDHDLFAGIAQTFSTYESRRSLDDPRPYARGINSFQLIRAGGRWWIVSVIWDTEHPGSREIPRAYLPDTSSD